MIRLPSLSIIVPFYNEEENIEATVREIRKAFPEHVDEYEIILVNDGSMDQTGTLAKRLEAGDERIRTVHHSTNLGYGAALRSGFSAARHEFIFYTDGDLQFDLKEFPKLLSILDDADIASGCRENRQDSWLRRFNGRCYNGLMRLLFNLDTRDIDCAFKIYRRHVFDAVHPTSNSVLIDAEIYILAVRIGMTIREIGVSHYPRTRGTSVGSTPKVLMNAVLELTAFCLKMIFTRASRSHRPSPGVEAKEDPEKID